MTETIKNKFQPILLGSDINVYGMARSFYEEFGVISEAYSSAALAPTKHSKLVNVNVFPGFHEDPTFIETIRKIVKQRPKNDVQYVLIPCGDGYAELVSKHREELSKDFICTAIDHELFMTLANKVSFYETCEKYNLPYPKTLIVTQDMVKEGESLKVPFDFPVALKPADSVMYLDADFEGRKKAFTIKDQAEFDLILGRVYNAGYTAEMICQDFIPGDDSNMRVLNAYVDKDSNVRMMCLGHPLLEDPTPDAIGNYVVIAPDYNDDIYKRIKSFLETINYTGFANFDMKYDPRDGEYKLFEMNLRQGRSSFYVTLNGYNLSRYIIQDRVLDIPFEETIYGNGDMLWMGVPKKIFTTYVKPSEAKDKANQMIKDGKWGTTVFYKKDASPKRFALMKYSFHLYHKRYKQYFKENKG
ncbi:carboxylate--amine ligase [Vagococcus coleopterorum]|uniref:Carboxylate--amine ligase n=1 Tax=Vagococcus coleopterorum TaxID=2714946 RepID=A0A6G8ANP7_9ENTE|nr:carboxylate--amine ligase [Vagococcus coleopterorum]QIL46617.1 carboxylate--amine ligase [Vagococcus coleopterorum]